MSGPRWFRFPWRTRAIIAAELEAEIAFHLERRAADLALLGLDPATARRQALDEFGDLIRTRRYCMEQDLAGERRLRWSDRLNDLAHELRVAWRRLVRQPGLVVLGVGTLALGIGATIAFWTVVQQLVLNPFPFPGGERIGVLWRAVPKSHIRFTPQLKDIEEWRRQARQLAQIEPVALDQGVLVRGEGAELVQVRRITERMLDMVALRPALGRGFSSEDRLAGAAPVAILGHSLWRTRFGADPAVVGQRVTLDSTSYEIVGVMPRAFEVLPGIRGAEGGVIALPLSERADPETSAHALVRLADGASFAGAREELRLLDQRTPPESAAETYVTRLDTGRDLLGVRNIRILLTLLGAVGLLLLIACTNVAHLLLGRVLSLQGDQAVRLALGASRVRLLQTGLLDALVIGLLGSALGLALAVPILRGLVAFRPQALDRLSAVQLSPVAAVVALGLGLTVSLISGLLPAWRGAGASPSALLHGNWAAGQRAGTRLREALLVTEIGLSVVLLIGAGLMARSLWHLGSLPVGLDPEGLITASLDLPRWRYATSATGEAFFAQLTEAIRSLPGISAVSRAEGVPPRTSVTFGDVEIAGRTLAEADVERFFAYQAVAPDYFSTMGIPLLEGRSFDPRVSGGEPNVVIINHGLARRYWPGGGALGHRIRIGTSGDYAEIIGVATDVPSLGVGEMREALQLYYPVTPSAGARDLIIRTVLPPDVVERQLRLAINRVDSLVPVRSFATVHANLARSAASERFTTVLLGGFAGFATLLFAAGLFGVLSQAVTLRTREIGVRVALGAAPRRVQGFIVRQGLRPLVLGLGLGLVGALLGGRVLASLLFEISARDLGTLAAGSGVTVVVALLASWVPARRATRLDPAAVLRE